MILENIKAKKDILYSIILINLSMKVAGSTTRDMAKARPLKLMETSLFVIGSEIKEKAIALKFSLMEKRKKASRLMVFTLVSVR